MDVAGVLDRHTMLHPMLIENQQATARSRARLGSATTSEP
jgi:hypothetical protein